MKHLTIVNLLRIILNLLRKPPKIIKSFFSLLTNAAKLLFWLINIVLAICLMYYNNIYVYYFYLSFFSLFVFLPLLSKVIMMIFFPHKCVVCRGKGSIEISLEIPGVTLSQCQCFACKGNRYFLNRKLFSNTMDEWYLIMLEADIKVKHHKFRLKDLRQGLLDSNAQVITSQYKEFESINKRQDFILWQTEQQQELEKSHVELYAAINKKAKIILYKKYLFELQEGYLSTLKKYSSDNVDSYGTALANQEQVSIAEAFTKEIDEISDYIESPLNENFTDKLILDIKRATEKLKLDYVSLKC